MAYIRVKKAKRKNGNVCEYAYIVYTKRHRKKQVKQRNKKYLGRVYRFDRANMMDFEGFHDIDDMESYVDLANTSKIVSDLIKVELFNHGFKEEKPNVYSNEGCYFDIKKFRSFNEKGNKIAIALNEGYLTGHAIRKLLRFKADYEEHGYDIAKMFVEAGLSIPQQIFIGYFNKIRNF